jgi:glycosyltransferase involved in cell wall biosynthesis
VRRALGLTLLEEQVDVLGRGQADLNRGYAADIESVWRRFDDYEARLGRLERLVEVATVMAWMDQATLRTQPLISVITPTYERAPLLARAIDSVRAQSYPAWEMLVCSDGSTDDTAAVVAAAGDERIRLLDAPHAGANVCRNRGLDAARGELIAYLDDDNRMHPDWLKAVAWAFEQRPEAEILHGGIVIDDAARVRGDGGLMPSAWMETFRRETIAEANVADASAIAHRAGFGPARWPEHNDYNGDWEMFRTATAETDPLDLPAIACFYYTDAAVRLSTDGRPAAASRP